MNDRKDDIIIGLLVIIIIMQIYTVFFGSPGATPLPRATVATTPEAPPGGRPDATADPEQPGQPGQPPPGQPSPPGP